MHDKKAADIYMEFQISGPAEMKVWFSMKIHALTSKSKLKFLEAQARNADANTGRKMKTLACTTRIEHEKNN
jgi:hypothetical protein